MRKKRLGLLLSLVVWCCAMTAQVVVFNPMNESDRTTSGEKTQQFITKDGITIRLSCPDNPNANAYGYFNYDDHYTVDANCVLTVSSANKKIVKVELKNDEDKDYPLKGFEDNSTGEKLEVYTKEKKEIKAKWVGYENVVELHNTSSVAWLEEIRVTLNTFSISESNYATMWLENSFKIPHGVIAHTVSVKDGVLCYPKTFREGDCVYKETPILIEGKKDDYVYEVIDMQNVTYENMLRPSEGKRVYGSKDFFYKLSYDNEMENIGFYWDSKDGHSIEIQEGKCFLRVPVDDAAVNAAKGFTLANVINKIGGVKNDKTSCGDGKIYSINGVYVGDDSTELAKGLYIQNGKKIVIK